MTFISGTVSLPIAHEPARADDALAQVPWARGDIRALLHGAAGCSPYLSGLIGQHGDWLQAAFDSGPDSAVATEIAALAESRSVKEAEVDLRRAKARVALVAALADLGGGWGLDDVTGALTRLADAAVDLAFRAALARDLARGRIPGAREEDLAESCGLFALAMGKMGAFELNYSSDIDLICLFDDSRYDAADLPEARAALVKAVRRAVALLSDLTGDGYVFRTDLRLRPDPSVTPIAVSTTAAEKYYESMGRTWERAAFVKARPAAGATEAGARFLDAIRPFIWRRSLDFATIEDAHDIRKKIRAHKRAGGDLDGRDLKVGPGGIREIEFFAQTRQLIAGGRDPDLRLRGTRPALARLAEKGWVDPGEAAQLDADYVRLRTLEHRVQMVRDAQTQCLPKAADEWTRLARFNGHDDPAALRAEVAALFDRVHGLTEDFFAPQRTEPTRAPEMSETAARLVERWQTYPALRSDRARAIFERLLPRLLEGFQRAAHPDEAMVQFDGFLGGLPAGVQVLSLFEANPHLIDLIVDICSTSPALARYLSAHSGVLDAVIGGDFFADWPGLAALSDALAATLDDPALDFEGRLDAARRWQKDLHFRIGVHHLRGLIGPQEAAGEYADLAQAVVRGVWAATCAEFARKYGRITGSRAVVVGMGSLGARSLSAQSDLDLIVIYDAAEDAVSDGRKALPARTYFARLTKALITALSARTAAGTLYDVDMRLRPSGRQGPAATAWRAFRTYQHAEAWTWEHLALTRARVVAGDGTLGEEMEAFRREVLAAHGARGAVIPALADMRRRLAEAKPQAGPWDAANGPGGQQDVELFAQAIALVEGAPCRRVPDQLAQETGLADAAAREALGQAHALFARTKAVVRLVSEGALDPDTIGAGGRAMLLRDTGHADLDGLRAALADARAAAARHIDVALTPD